MKESNNVLNNKFLVIKKVSILGILGNIFLLFIKALIGFSTKSQAMIADSMNSASDIFASLMTFIGNKIASEPGDESHNLGHGKAEYLFSMFISISMILLSFKLFYDSLYSIIFGSSFTFSWLLVVISIITIITKFILYLYTKKAYTKYPNLLLKANMKDHRNDCIITTFTLISALLTLLNIYFVDGLVGICISIWICFTGIKIFIESFNVLMDMSIDNTTKNTILDIVKLNPEIKDVISLISKPVGVNYLVFITIAVDGNLTTFASHDLADNLEKEISKLDNVSTTVVHVEPYLDEEEIKVENENI